MATRVSDVRNSVSSALNVIVPIGGIGSRFAKEGVLYYAVLVWQ